jgi:hypothetical protein
MSGGRFVRDFSSSDAPSLAVHFAAIPRAQLPAVLNGMPITDDVAAAYHGHESLLKFRSLHSAPCYARFDAVRKCFVSGLAPHTEAECRTLFEEYRACSRDVKLRIAKRRDEVEAEERRQRASVVVRVDKSAAGGSTSSGS